MAESAWHNEGVRLLIRDLSARGFDARWAPTRMLFDFEVAGVAVKHRAPTGVGGATPATRAKWYSELSGRVSSPLLVVVRGRDSNTLRWDVWSDIGVLDAVYSGDDLRVRGLVASTLWGLIAAPLAARARVSA